VFQEEGSYLARTYNSTLQTQNPGFGAKARQELWNSPGGLVKIWPVGVRAQCGTNHQSFAGGVRICIKRGRSKFWSHTYMNKEFW
jgi:hypothetical protein